MCWDGKMSSKIDYYLKKAKCKAVYITCICIWLYFYKDIQVEDTSDQLYSSGRSRQTEYKVYKSKFPCIFSYGLFSDPVKILLLLFVSKPCPTLFQPRDWSPPVSSEAWSGLPFPSPGDLPDWGIKPMPLSLASRFFTTEPPGKTIQNSNLNSKHCLYLKSYS